MIEADRFITPVAVSRSEEQQDMTVRPQTLADYRGQPVVREQMEIFIHAARQRGEALDHTLILVHRVWARRRWPILSPTRWAARSKLPPARCLKKRGMWQHC